MYNDADVERFADCSNACSATCQCIAAAERPGSQPRERDEVGRSRPAVGEIPSSPSSRKGRPELRGPVSISAWRAG